MFRSNGDWEKQSDLIYDVGLHRGEDTSFYLAKGFRVVAFEADPDHVAHCEVKFHDFLKTGQLTIVAGAIVGPTSIEAGKKEVTFYKNELHSVWGTVESEWKSRNDRLGANSQQITVRTVDFGQVLRTHGVPYYMKIDIEGCDRYCLEYLHNTPVRPDYISIESNKASFHAISREVDELVNLGYASFQAVEQSAIPDTHIPPHPAREGVDVSHRFEEGSSGLFGRELPGEWITAKKLLRKYRAIHWGYYLLGDDGVLNTLRFRGAGRIRQFISTLIRLRTGAAVPGWYDTHARLVQEK